MAVPWVGNSQDSLPLNGVARAHRSVPKILHVKTSQPAALAALGGESSIPGAMIGDQTHPAVAWNANGGFVAWEDNSVTDKGLRIRAERLDGDFMAVGAPFVVSSANPKSRVTGDQEHPAVAMLPDGSAIIVWQGGLNGSQNIYARLIDPTGALVKKDVRVSTYRKTYQSDPVIATLADGTAMVVWASYGEDGSRLGIFGRILAANGRPHGREFQVNQFTANNQRTPAVAVLSSGNFVVTWISELQQGPSSVDVYGRIFDNSGDPLGDEFLVNTSANHICANPSVVGSPDGGFAVAWSQRDELSLTSGALNGVWVSGTSTTRSTNSWDVYGRLFDSNHAPTTDPFCLNSYTYGDQYGPRLSVLGTHFLAVWTSLGQDGSWQGVFGQAFTSGGTFEGSEIPVNDTTISRQIQPAIASNGMDRFVAVWSSFVAGTSFDLFAKTYYLR